MTKSDRKAWQTYWYKIAGIAMLAGCAQTDPLRDQAVDVLAGASDHARETAELILCRGITVGAWVRAYSNDPAKAAAWKELCSGTVKATP